MKMIVAGAIRSGVKEGNHRQCFKDNRIFFHSNFNLVLGKDLGIDMFLFLHKKEFIKISLNQDNFD